LIVAHETVFAQPRLRALGTVVKRFRNRRAACTCTQTKRGRLPRVVHPSRSISSSAFHMPIKPGGGSSSDCRKDSDRGA
jgi:hypothetical protein